MSQAFKFLSLIVFLLLSGCYQKNNIVNHEAGLAAFNADSLKRHISEVAMDLLVL
jgi:hypothetical protein